MDTKFRNWMTHICDGWGDRPDWPWLLCASLESEFLREREQPHEYMGKEVAICRDNHDWRNAREPEATAVYGLYDLCREQSHRCLTIGNQRYWLLGYEWPNQGNHRGRRADLVGLTEDGGLVVFECKRGEGGYTPMAAILEGLDYLSCLTTEANHLRIQNAVNFWRENEVFGLDLRFREIALNRQSSDAVILLADQVYFDQFINRTEGQRGAGLRQFARGARQFHGQLRLDFAVTDFSGVVADWLNCD